MMENNKPKIDNELGAIRIADEVVATIAGLAAAEVEGVIMSGGWGNELVEKLGRKTYGKGVKVEVGNDTASIDVFAVLEYGYPIPEVGANIQSEVKMAVESMTGLKVTAVNVHILSVSMKKEKPAAEEKPVEEETYI